MEQFYITAFIWLGLAVASAIIARHLKVSIALIEICIGVAVAALLSPRFIDSFVAPNSDWLRFLASIGSVLLTFLAGAELHPRIIRTKIHEVTVVGIIGFLAPFLGCTVLARFLLHWDIRASLIAGIALSTTSMAVVYAVMLETGLNKTEFGKGILGACFVNDLGTVLALSLLFAPFSIRTAIFGVITLFILFYLPKFTHWIAVRYAFRTAAIRTKLVLLVLFGLGALALWSGSEAVLPAYIAGAVLAGNAAQDEDWIRRMRTMTIGLLTPFYFLRAGTLVSLPSIIAAPIVFAILFGGKVISKIIGLLPFISLFRKRTDERWFYTLMMSTGLTFGTISSLFGFEHGIISREQYSYLVATVIASAVIPTLIASRAFFPSHLSPSELADTQPNGYAAKEGSKN